MFVSDAFAFHFVNFAKLMIIGVIFGLTGSLFAKGLAYLKTFMAEKIANPIGVFYCWYCLEYTFITLSWWDI